ncbi:phosphoribosyltransferase family protein [Pusillimonas sp.]|uniref:phosphoribosyltransferase family protein n=1 Tax=Pusillimonas sp. TaxID=3040095 RepID=UPI0037C99524
MKAYSCDYYWVESRISGYLAEWRLAGFDAVVAIARGGLAPGVMASTALGLPLYALSYDRAGRRVSWFTRQAPQAGSRVLLVEDIAGRGTTLSDSIEFLRGQGFTISVFTLAWDTQSRVVPDYGFQVPAGYRAWFPWERESITDAFGATGNRPSQAEHEYASWAMDLDGILLPDIPEDDYLHDLEAALLRRDALEPHAMLPNRDLRDLPIITGRPEQDRARTQAWLDRHGFTGRLIMRDETRYTAPETALHKAQAIMEQRYTHFIESDAIQALEIASHAKVARVLWWNGSRAMAVYAHEAPEMAGDAHNLQYIGDTAPSTNL